MNSFNRIICGLVLICNVPFDGLTQPVSDVYKVADSLYSLELYKESLLQIDQNESKVMAYFGQKSQEYLDLLILKGNAHQQLKNYSVAVEIYLKITVELKDKSDALVSLGMVNHFLGQSYFELEQFDESEDAFLAAAEIYELKFGSNSEPLFYLFLDIAELYQQLDASLQESELRTEIIAMSANNIEISLEDFQYNLMRLSFLGIKLTDDYQAELYSIGLLTNIESAGATKDVYLKDVYLNLIKVYSHKNQVRLAEELISELNLELENEKDPTKKSFYSENLTFYSGCLAYRNQNYIVAIDKLDQSYLMLEPVQEIKRLRCLGMSFCATGNFAKSEALIKKAITLGKTNLSKREQNEIEAELCELYEAKGDYGSAIDGYSRLQEKIGDIHKVEYQKYNFLKGQLFYEQGDFDQAEEVLIRTIEMIEEIGVYSDIYVSSLNCLSMLYLDKSEFAKAELLITECLTFIRKGINSNTQIYISTLNNLGAFYHSVGNLQKALDYYLTVLELKSNQGNVLDADYASILNNVGLIFDEVNEHEEALVYLDSARVIELELKGGDHPDYAECLNNVAMEQLKLGQLDKAEGNLKLALKIMLNKEMSNHPDYAIYIKNLGIVFKAKGEDEKALKYLLESRTKLLSYYGEYNQNLALVNIELGEAYLNLNQLDVAKEYYDSGINALMLSLKNYLPFLSENEKKDFFNKISKYFDSYFNFCMKLFKAKQRGLKEAFELSLSLKGLLLTSSKAMRNVITNSGDDKLITLYDEWIKIRKHIAEILTMNKENQNENVNELIEKSNQLEKELYTKADALGANLNQNKTYEEIQQKLKSNESLVEFIRFTEPSEGTEKYAAIVLNGNNKQTDFIELFEETELIELIRIYGFNDYNYIAEVYKFSEDNQTSLYQLIWSPLEKALENTDRVFVSPVGMIHKISLYALAKGDGQFLIDSYELLTVHSSSDIDKINSTYSVDMNEIVLMGGIEYNTDKSSKEVWEYLPGTKTEVEEINAILLNKNADVHFKTSTEATETYFKEMAEKSDVIHIATHGFFFPDQSKVLSLMEKEAEHTEDVEFRGGASGVSLFTSNNDPLMRSGLVFAGVHDLWTENLGFKQDDGVLTAMEVSQLNLSNVKLAVLSACETGLGEIEGNEGVYGLKRTFKIAGVKSLILSLWQVPDKETKEFMTRFYGHLYGDDGLNVRAAFEKSQREMRALYEPYFWAAFVLIE